MALDVEEVVDGRMDGEEPLRGRGRFEPLHLSLSANLTETPAPLGITVGRWR